LELWVDVDRRTNRLSWWDSSRWREVTFTCARADRRKDEITVPRTRLRIIIIGETTVIVSICIGIIADLICQIFISITISIYLKLVQNVYKMRTRVRSTYIGRPFDIDVNGDNKVIS